MGETWRDSGRDMEIAKEVDRARESLQIENRIGRDRNVGREGERRR